MLKFVDAMTTNPSSSYPCAYQDQDSPMTLREGLAEYYAMNHNITPPDEASAEGEVFFASHDVTHVVFGTTTTMRDEGINDMWSVFALDIGVREYASRGFAVPEVKALFAFDQLLPMIGEMLILPFRIPKIWRHARKMSKPWPWKGYVAYLDMPLGEIRREFNIEVI